MILSTVKQLELTQYQPTFDLPWLELLPTFNHVLGSITELCKKLNIILFWFSLILMYRFFKVVAKSLPRFNYLLTRTR